MIRERIGKLLLEAGLISDQQLQKALDTQRQTKARLGSVLVRQMAISDGTLLQFLGHQYGVPIVEQFPHQPGPELAQLVPCDLAREFLVAPLQRIGTRVTLAMVDPSNVGLIDELKFRTGCHIIPMVALEGLVLERIRLLYDGDLRAQAVSSEADGIPPVGKADERSLESLGPAEGRRTSLLGPQAALNSKEMEALLEKASSSLSYGDPVVGGEPLVEEKAPIVELVNHILQVAAELGASDIHLEPYEASVRVRYRLDGVLHTVMTYAISLRNAVISRLKIMASLDIAERRLPQDGRMRFKGGESGGIDVRVSLLPSLHGEKVVLRLLDRSGLSLDLARLGFEEEDLAKLLAALDNPDGMILVTGPTGSGKTTTLYAALQVLNTPDVNIVTAEDPVEYSFPGITQVQIKEHIGLNFSTVLRAFLRQDPDVMMVGEIRDQETARIAIKAALTGHRVLSTLHTNDAVRSVTRLLDMGIEPFLISSSVSLILAQRLVRRICSRCHTAVPLSPDQLTKLGFTPAEAEAVVPRRGQGCPGCHHTGYKGRVALFEVLPLSEEFQSVILRRHSLDELRKSAVRAGLTTLRRKGLNKIKSGVTTVEEVVGATSLDLPDG